MINKKRLIKYFTDLVKISSPSLKEHDVAEYIINTCRKLEYSIKKFKCGDSCNLLLKTKTQKAGTPYLFAAHMDTVTPCENVKPIVSKTKITSDGTTILGADNKAVIASILEILTVFKEKKITHGPVEFLFTCSEETGLLGIKGFDLKHTDAKYAFAFDAEGSPGSIIIKAPYQTNMDIHIKGKAAHAGINPEKGISAIRTAAEIITKIPQGKIDKETSANVGKISGGIAYNIVPEDAVLNIEVRSIDRGKLMAVLKKIEDIARSTAKFHKAKITIKRIPEYFGYSINENDKILKILINAMKEINLVPSFSISGGGSDINVISNAGIKAVNLSCGMKNFHTTNEYINIKDLVTTTELIMSIIRNDK